MSSSAIARDPDKGIVILNEVKDLKKNKANLSWIPECDPSVRCSVSFRHSEEQSDEESKENNKAIFVV